MKQFKSHPDGLVYVQDETKRYIDTVQNFAADAVTAGIVNPDAARNGSFVYEQEGAGKYATIQPTGMHDAATEGRWDEADAAIGAIDALLAAQAARRAV
jgi:hypothetical protein